MRELKVTTRYRAAMQALEALRWRRPDVWERLERAEKEGELSAWVPYSPATQIVLTIRSYGLTLKEFLGRCAEMRALLGTAATETEASASSSEDAIMRASWVCEVERSPGIAVTIELSAGVTCPIKPRPKTIVVEPTLERREITVGYELNSACKEQLEEAVG